MNHSINQKGLPNARSAGKDSFEKRLVLYVKQVQIRYESNKFLQDAAKRMLTDLSRSIH